MTLNRRHWLARSAAMGIASQLPILASANSKPFSFAAIGDIPYSDFGESILQQVLDDIAQEQCQLVIHVGDLKASGEPCSNELLARRVALLNASPLPLVYTPGDNEWVDCDRDSKNGTYEPEDRLQRIRALTTAGAESLGQKRLPLERQAAIPENARWMMGGCAFGMINLAGSFNGANQRNIDQALRLRRDQAASEWLNALPGWATQMGAQQLVLIWHANPDFAAWPDSDSIRKVKRLAYGHVKQALQDILGKWPRPVLVIHGDTHRFRFDRPWPQIDARLQRLEVFGSPFISSWAKVTLAANGKEFAVQPLNIGRRQPGS